MTAVFDTGAVGVWGAVLFGVFVWWFSTGAILWLATRPGRWPEYATVAAAPLAAAAVIGLERAGTDLSPWGAFEAFSCAILVWGWFELAFLSGVILGPSRAECPPGVDGWDRFRAAWRALSHHEIGLLLAFLLLVALVWEQPNRFGLYTFAVLFFARISAKLNVFLGVANITEEFLPPAVRHLKSFFRRRPINVFFPFGVMGLNFATAFCMERAYAAPAGSGAEAGFVLVATLCALALVEHWVMVLPVQDAALWRWLLPQEKRAPRKGGETTRRAGALSAEGRADRRAAQ
ncbi:MAG: putative photosynthetic complex assembly protein PuhE [Pseudomonadota bacterium]